MFETLQRLFKKPSAHALALQELEEARRQALSSHAAAEYHIKMAEYYEGVINRLTGYVYKEN